MKNLFYSCAILALLLPTITLGQVNYYDNYKKASKEISQKTALSRILKNIPTSRKKDLAFVTANKSFTMNGNLHLMTNTMLLNSTNLKGIIGAKSVSKKSTNSNSGRYSVVKFVGLNIAGQEVGSNDTIKNVIIKINNISTSHIEIEMDLKDHSTLFTDSYTRIIFKQSSGNIKVNAFLISGIKRKSLSKYGLFLPKLRSSAIKSGTNKEIKKMQQTLVSLADREL